MAQPDDFNYNRYSRNNIINQLICFPSWVLCDIVLQSSIFPQQHQRRRRWNSLKMFTVCLIWFIIFVLGVAFAILCMSFWFFSTTHGLWIYRFQSIGKNIYLIKFMFRLSNHLEFFLSASPNILDLINKDSKAKAGKNTAWNASCPVHTMMPDETLFILAFKYGVTVDEIIALNPTANSTNRIEALGIRLPCYST